MAADEITEEEVLSRWDKIKQWIEIVVATKKVAVMIWSLVFATGTALVYGEATDTKPIRDVAVVAGILDEQPQDITTFNDMYRELSDLIDDVSALENIVANHQHNYPDHVAGPRGPKGAQGPQGEPGRDGANGKDAVGNTVDDALARHVLDDH